MTVKITVKREGAELGSVEGMSSCNPVDCFVKLEGRRLAMLRAFKRDENHVLLSRSNRTRIAQRLLGKLKT